MNIVSKEVQVNQRVKLGGENILFLIGGPCVIESEEHAFRLASEIKKICEKFRVPFIFKASYDKANRSSLSSYRGPGLKRGLEILKSIKEELKIPVLSDVHETNQVGEAAEVLDVIQIPAFLCRQTDLVVQAANTQRVINVKKGQFLSPREMGNIVEKILAQGNEKIILTERGTFFGYQNLVFDVRSIAIMKRLGFPVCVDASHLVQRPGQEGKASGGEAEFIPDMAKAGVSVGADGVFLEIHDDPSRALSDKYNSLIINKLEALLALLIRLQKVLRESENT